MGVKINKIRQNTEKQQNVVHSVTRNDQGSFEDLKESILVFYLIE